MTFIRKTLTDILESQAFDRLEPFRQSAAWTSFAPEEKILLARLLVMQGATELRQGNIRAFESFDQARQVSSEDPEILFQQGIHLASYRENIRCLTLASQLIQGALKKKPLSCQGWVLQAQVLVDIALFEGESSFFIEADQCFERGASLWNQDSEGFIVKKSFFWKWGACLASLGKISGEPSDFIRAIDKYRLAYDLDCQEANFLIDFGQSFVDLGTLLEKEDYFKEALILFNRAVSDCPEAFDGWFHQACCLQSLAALTNNDQLLEQSDHCFAKSVEISPENHHLWLKWGQLENTAGKLKRDLQKLEGSLLKFARANELEPRDSDILSHWGEAELSLGVQEERLDLIQSAHIKILASLEIQPEDPNGWYLYGLCLTELGRYFSEEDYYHQAIEKFEYGLSLAGRHPFLWYGMALAQFALGELTEQKQMFEMAVYNCEQVIESGGEGFPSFWNDWGVALLKLGEMTQEASYVELAIEKFERALKQPLDYVEVDDLELEWVYNYSCAYDLLGDLKEEPHYIEKAIQIFQQILQLNPNYFMARYNLALALSHLGEAMYDVEYYHRAMEQYEILLDQDPEDEMIHLDFGMALINLGLLVYDPNHLERSQALYRRAESHFVQAAGLGSTQVYYQFAGLYSITGHYHQAIHYLERAQVVGVLPGIEDLLHDEWLDRLRQTPLFRQFINELSTRQPMDDKE